MKNYIYLISEATTNSQCIDILMAMATDKYLTREEYGILFTLVIKKSLIVREVPLQRLAK